MTRTLQQSAVGERHECPDIPCPVRVVQSARKWEEALTELRQVSDERPEAGRKDGDDGRSKLDEVGWQEAAGRSEAVGP
jgi:hypothetical protein